MKKAKNTKNKLGGRSNPATIVTPSSETEIAKGSDSYESYQGGYLAVSSSPNGAEWGEGVGGTADDALNKAQANKAKKENKKKAK